LLLEIGSISSPDVAAVWAREALAAKNSLTAADAKLVEDGFERRLSELSPSEIASNDRSSEIQVAAAHKGVAAEPTDPGQTTGIDKSALAVAAPRRYRNREHLRSVAKQPCLICGRRPASCRRRSNYTSWWGRCGASGAGLTISGHAHPDCRV
jgi:hypothetical protein